MNVNQRMWTLNTTKNVNEKRCSSISRQCIYVYSGWNIRWNKVNRSFCGWNTERNGNTKTVNEIFESSKKWLPNKLETVTKINKNGVHLAKKNQSLRWLTSANAQHRNNNFRNFVCSFVLLPLPLCASRLLISVRCIPLKHSHASLFVHHDITMLACLSLHFSHSARKMHTHTVAEWLHRSCCCSV